MDDRGVGDSEFSTQCVLEALDIHTATLLNNREVRLQSGESETDKIPPGSYVVHDECDCEESGEEEEGDSERIRAIKQQKRDAKTKSLIENRVQRAGLVNGRWTVFPRDFKFGKGMTVKHLIADSWFLEDQRKRIPPFLTLQPSNLTPSQQKVFRKMRAIMRLVKKHALEDNCWAGDGPKHWNHVKTSKLWDKIKGTFQRNYYTIQRTVTRRVV